MVASRASATTTPEWAVVEALETTAMKQTEKKTKNQR